MVVLGRHHIRSAARLKRRTGPGFIVLAAALAQAGAAAQPGAAPQADPAAVAVLREEVLRLLKQSGPEAAIGRLQAALRDVRDDPAVRAEYVDLHVSLGRMWLGERRFDLAEAALRAALGVDGGQAEAAELVGLIEAARVAAGKRLDEVDRLVSLELFDAALDALSEIEALRSDLAKEVASRRGTAWLGAADDHYLAGNFNEAFALYERLLASGGGGMDVCSRWAISLSLALSEADFSAPADREGCGRLLARAIDVLKQTREPVVGQIIGGLLAERAGQLAEAGRTYCEALGEGWALPPAARRRHVVAELRRRCVRVAQELYEGTPPRRREGLWRSALAGEWKRAASPHFVVEARSEWIAQRVAEAGEHHFSRLVEWMGVEAVDWGDAVQVRVHESLERLHEATQTGGATRAVSRTRVVDSRPAQRSIELYQGDPWLLSGTLPHELAHLVFAERLRGEAVEGRPLSPPCLALDEGLAVQVEPPARRLRYRRIAPRDAGEVDGLLSAATAGDDPPLFYARSAGLVEMVVRRGGVDAVVREALGPAGETWRRLGFDDAGAMQREWRAWYADYRRPARLPLMILAEPAQGRNRGGG